MKIRPLGDNVVVEPVTETKTPGGILLPDSAQKKAGRGKVLAVGPGRRQVCPTNSNSAMFISPPTTVTLPVDVQVGEVVSYAIYAGHEEDEDGRKVRVIAEGEILGVLED